MLVSWIAALAVLMSALAPTLSYALVSGSSDGLSQICTARGARSLRDPAAPGKAAPSPLDKAAPDNCPYCSLHVDAVLPDAGLSSLECVSLGAAHAGRLELRPTRSGTAWLRPRSQAPPQST
jgi:hypothetical protein